MSVSVGISIFMALPFKLIPKNIKDTDYFILIFRELYKQNLLGKFSRPIFKNTAQRVF